jgi:hypothetical protein
MSGAREREYVLARRVLLDALDALGPHRDADGRPGKRGVGRCRNDSGVVCLPGG